MGKCYWLVFLAFCLISPAHAEPLRVVTLLSPPLAFEEHGKVSGMATEVVREALRRMDLEAEFEIMPWKRALHMTRYGETDALFYAVRTAEREEWFHYPDESLVIEATTLVKRTTGAISLQSPRSNHYEFTLGIGRGYYYGPKLEAFLKNNTFQKVEEATTIESNFQKLLEGRIDAFLSDLALAHYYIKTNSGTEGVDFIRDDNGNPIVLDAVESYLVFSKVSVDERVARRFGEVLREMKADGTYSRIRERYQ